MNDDIYRCYYNFACTIMANAVECYKEDYFKALQSDDPEEELDKCRGYLDNDFFEHLAWLILHCEVDTLIQTVEDNIYNSYKKGKKRVTFLYSKKE